MSMDADRDHRTRRYRGDFGQKLRVEYQSDGFVRFWIEGLFDATMITLAPEPALGLREFLTDGPGPMPDPQETE